MRGAMGLTIAFVDDAASIVRILNSAGYRIPGQKGILRSSDWVVVGDNSRRGGKARWRIRRDWRGR